jgi:hypothetical protein
MLRTLLGYGRRVTALLGIALAAACGHFGMGGAAPADAFIIFHNESLDQADVYGVAPGTDFVRLGTVLPGRVDTLRVRSSVIGQGSGVNIFARLLARSNTPSTGNIPLHSGDVFEVRLTSDGRSLIALPAAR